MGAFCLPPGVGVGTLAFLAVGRGTDGLDEMTDFAGLEGLAARATLDAFAGLALAGLEAFASDWEAGAFAARGAGAGAFALVTFWEPVLTRFVGF